MPTASNRLLALLLIIPAGCAGPPRRDAVPPALHPEAQVPGFPGVRYREGDVDALAHETLEAFRREQAFLKASGQAHTGSLPPLIFLALSGGGENGAFGAGLLNGWTAAGDRPEFKTVTGISTGALIAPFAFLGPRYDACLKEAYTTISRRDIFKPRGIVGGLLSDAFTDTTPLRGLLARYVTGQMIDEIAAEYAKGRLLFVGTTDLDAQHAVIWNLTGIAASQDPGRLQLFRNVMLASAAIPAAFPPVLFDVEVAGGRYRELHVDGGTVASVFVYPPALKLKDLEREAGVTREHRLYVIRNGKVDPEWDPVRPRTLPVAGRAISTLTHAQAWKDLYTIYFLAQRDGVEYNLGYIPADFNAPHPQPFDTQYMQQLFDLGYRMAEKGYRWDKLPPGYSR